MKSLNEFLKQLIENKLSESGQTLKTVKFSEITFEENMETHRLTVAKVIARISSEIISDTIMASESYNLTIYGPAQCDYSENNGYVLGANQSLNFTRQRLRSSSSALT